MAAGLGTRLRPFSEHVPKPLTPILGIPCSQFAIDALATAGVADVVANLHFLPEKTRSGLEALSTRIQFSDETAALLGSAGGIRRAMPNLESMGGSSSFYVLNADTLCSLDLRELGQTHARLRARHGVHMTLALLDRPEAGEDLYREILVDSSGERITGVGQKSGRGRMYVGCAVLEPEALKHVPPGGAADFVETILRPLIEENRVGVHLFSGEWMDVGSPRLWWKTQLDVLSGLESGALPAGWSRMIRASCRREAEGCWVAMRAPATDALLWQGPCYWDGVGPVPDVLGPEAILYGEAPAGVALRSGIGAHGIWQPL